MQRHRLLVIWLVLCAHGCVLAQSFPYPLEVERKQALLVAGPVDFVVDQFIRLIAPVTAWLRWFLITWVLIPMRDAYLWLPYTAVLALLAAIGWAIGGLRSAAVCVAYFGLIALSGWWDRAMITVYTVTISVLIAWLVGLPLGIRAARKPARAERALGI